MGAATYRRGTKSVARGIEADFVQRTGAAVSPRMTGAEPLNWSDDRSRLHADLMNAQAEVVALKAHAAASEERARAADERAERSHKLAARHFRLHMAAARRLAWAWKVIRAYVSPRLVQEFRDEDPEPRDDEEEAGS
jgi:hypothetical protein